MVYLMPKYIVYQARYRQLSGNYPKSHCDLLSLSLIQCANPRMLILFSKGSVGVVSTPVGSM